MNLNRKSVSEPCPNKSNHRNWEKCAFWGFAIFAFAALIFALCVIWDKCSAK